MKDLITSLGALGALLLLSGCLTGCTTTSAEGTKVYDPVKTEQIKAAVQPIVAGVARRVIENSPAHADEIALYFRAVGGALCSAVATTNLGPEQVLAAVDAATANLQKGLDQEILDAKNGLLAVYRIAYADRFKAELPADRWPYHILDLLCSSIDSALRDAGKTGCK